MYLFSFVKREKASWDKKNSITESNMFVQKYLLTFFSKITKTSGTFLFLKGFYWAEQEERG